jgi:hypothetical protein
MGLSVISDLIADARSKLKASAIAKLCFHLAGETKEDVALLAPMVGSIAGRVFDHADADRSELLSAPQCEARFAWMACGFDGGPIRDSERELGDLHGDGSRSR